MNTKIQLIIVVCFISLSLIIGCGKKEEYQTGEITPKESTDDTSSVLTIKPRPIDYDSMLVVVSELVEAVKENPTDIDYRRELVASSYDTTWETILAAGFGKPTSESQNESIALKNAERAATIDAWRWAAYIKRWSIDPNIPNLDTLNVEIQGGKVVAKKMLPDKTVWVLVEIHSSKIL